MCKAYEVIWFIRFINFTVCDARPQPISRLEPFRGFKREAQQQSGGGGGGGAPPGNGQRAPGSVERDTGSPCLEPFVVSKCICIGFYTLVALRGAYGAPLARRCPRPIAACTC